MGLVNYAVDYGKAANLVKYVGERPGVDRVGEHGLFFPLPMLILKRPRKKLQTVRGTSGHM